MIRYPCPYLSGEVELTEERECPIAERHPDLLPKHRDFLAKTLVKPDQVRSSIQFASAKLFSRWYTDLRQGKHVVVVVVSELGPSKRHWIITAYMARKLQKERLNGNEADVQVRPRS